MSRNPKDLRLQRRVRRLDEDDLGNGWTTNSELRAHGKKQAAIKDGVVVAGTVEGATHSLGLFHAAGIRDGAAEVKFQMPENESLDLEFFDFASILVRSPCLAPLVTRAHRHHHFQTG